jgi:hypothetical protein
MHPPLLEPSHWFLFVIPKDTDQIIKRAEARAWLTGAEQAAIGEMLAFRAQERGSGG